MTETFGRNSSKLLLVVDDDRAYNETVATFLRRRGFKVEQRYDGWEAAEAITSLKPALVLMDIALPGLNGIAVAKYLLGRPPVPEIILMSGYDDWLSMAHFSELKVLRLLNKPLPLRMLEKFVRECLTRPRAA
jgi:DNA-binding response OmpR family regulator